MEIDKVYFETTEKLPPELEGKTLGEVFDLVKDKSNHLIKMLQKNPNKLDELTLNDQLYLRLAQMFKDMANGDTSSVSNLGIKSPFTR